MEKLLLIGINTRPMVNSAVKLDYQVYSTSYFACFDRIKIANEKNYNPTDKFEEDFNPLKLIEIAKDYIDEVDYIIPISGIDSSYFNKKTQKKILGNKNIDNIKDKYKFYKKIRHKFRVPKTYKLNNIDEANEIIKNNKSKQYIIKPIKGSGGLGVNLLNNDSYNQLNDNEFILQEYINGKSVSSSVLATKNDAKTIINSRLLTTHDYNNGNDFIYIGNILPYNKEEMNEISSKLIKKLKLIGSNGVDYILKEDELYIIEVNPRIQGTYECVEEVYGINMLEAHIKACKGEIIEIPEAKCYSYKKIIYAPFDLEFKNINLNNIYDLPYPNIKIQKNEPLLTIIENNKNYKKLIENVKITTDKIKKIQPNKG